MAFMGVIIANTTTLNTQIYDLTSEQKAILSNTDSGIIEFLGKVVVLVSVSSSHQLIAIFTAILSIIFALAVAKALKEVFPALPS